LVPLLLWAPKTTIAGKRGSRRPTAKISRDLTVFAKFEIKTAKKKQADRAA